MKEWSLLKKLIWLKATQGAGYEWATVTGNAPLSLPSAVAKEIQSLTQYGLCNQASTPTPTSPVDIYCNNGALRMVDDELPSGYKRVLGFTCNNNAMWEITGFNLKGSDTVRISFSVNAACNVFGCYQGADATDNYDLYVSTTSNSKYFRYGSGTYLSAWSAADLGERFDVIYTPNGSQGMPQDSTWSPLTFTSANNLLIGATTLTGTSAKLKGNLYGNFIVDGRLKLIPCERVSDSVLGYYDTYSETFYEPYTGFDGAVSLGYDGSHYVFQTVGAPEVITVCGKNLLNPATDTTGSYINQNGELVGGSSYRYSDIIPVKAGKYIVSGVNNPNTGNSKRIHGYLNGVWQSQLNSAYVAKDTAYTLTFTVPSGVDGVRLSYYTGDVDVMIEAGETATEYEAYVSHGTASAENLYSVPDTDYVDTQEIISGAVTHNTRVVVFDGTENGWSGDFNTASGTIARFYMSGFGIGASGRSRLLCTHFKFGTGNADGVCFIAASGHLFFERLTADEFTTIDAWKEYLTAQYAAGTPVICVVPLAEETTEQVTAQALRTAKGTNSISVVAEVSPITLECHYAKEV